MIRWSAANAPYSGKVFHVSDWMDWAGMKEMVAAIVGGLLVYLFGNFQYRQKRKDALTDAREEEVKRIIVALVPVRDSIQIFRLGLHEANATAVADGVSFLLEHVVVVDAQTPLDEFLLRAKGASQLPPALLRKLLAAAGHLEDIERNHRAIRELSSVSPNSAVDMGAYVGKIDATWRTTCECIHEMREFASSETKSFIDSALR